MLEHVLSLKTLQHRIFRSRTTPTLSPEEELVAKALKTVHSKSSNEGGDIFAEADHIESRTSAMMAYSTLAPEAQSYVFESIPAELRDEIAGLIGLRDETRETIARNIGYKEMSPDEIAGRLRLDKKKVVRCLNGERDYTLSRPEAVARTKKAIKKYLDGELSRADGNRPPFHEYVQASAGFEAMTEDEQRSFYQELSFNQKKTLQEKFRIRQDLLV